MLKRCPLVAIFVLVAFASTVVFSSTGNLTKPRPPRIVTLQGEAAHKWLEHYWHQDIKHLAAHMKAVSLLQTAGYHPTDQWMVQLLGEPPQEDSVIVKVWTWLFPNLQAEDIYAGNGVMWLYGWTDGDPNTWEGEMGGESWDGGYGDGAQQWQLNNPGQVNWADGYVDGAAYSAAAHQWATCYLAGCGLAASACAIANIIDAEAGWLPCFVSWCGGSFVVCGVGYLSHVFHREP